MLEINGLTVAYGERLALRNFSLSMQEGEIVAVVGESGSGKTTAIRSVLGLLPPGGAVTEGTISFEGQQLQGLSPREWKALRGEETFHDLSGFRRHAQSHPYHRLPIP